MIALAVLSGCAHRLGHADVTFGPPSPAAIVQPSTDVRRWYLPMQTDALGPVLWFVDTGYTYTTCDDGLVEALGLETRGRVKVRGEIGSVRATTAELPAFELAGHTVEGLGCQVRDLHTTSSLSDPIEVPIAGVIGMDLLQRFRVVFAPDRGLIELFDPGSVEPLPRSDPSVVRLRRSGAGNRARLQLDTEGARRAWPIVDTGATNTYVDGGRLGLEPTTELDGVTVRGTGQGGAEVRTMITYELDGVQIGGISAGSATLVDRDRRWWDPGLLGLDLLSRFHQEYDFSRGYVRLRPAPPVELPLFQSWWPDGGVPAGHMPGAAVDAVTALP